MSFQSFIFINDVSHKTVSVLYVPCFLQFIYIYEYTLYTKYNRDRNNSIIHARIFNAIILKCSESKNSENFFHFISRRFEQLIARILFLKCIKKNLRIENE